MKPKITPKIFDLSPEELSHIPHQSDPRKQKLLEEAIAEITAVPPPKCYRCTAANFKFKYEYENHCINSHPHLMAYPGLIEIKNQKLIHQYMPWEI